MSKERGFIPLIVILIIVGISSASASALSYVRLSASPTPQSYSSPSTSPSPSPSIVAKIKSSTTPSPSSTPSTNTNSPTTSHTSTSTSNSSPTPTPSPSPSTKAKITAESCSSFLTVEGDASYYATYTNQDGQQYKIYFIDSGKTAKLTAHPNPSGAYINWRFGWVSPKLPNGGTLTVDSNDPTVVTFKAPINTSNEEEGTYVRAVYKESSPEKWCPEIDFAVRPTK